MRDLHAKAARALGACGLGIASLGLAWALVGTPTAHAAYGPTPSSSVPSATTTPGNPTTTTPASSAISSSSATTSKPVTEPASGLAFTGADVGITIAGSAVAIGAGGALVLAVRRRRSGPGTP